MFPSADEVFAFFTVAKSLVISELWMNQDVRMLHGAVSVNFYKRGLHAA